MLFFALVDGNLDVRKIQKSRLKVKAAIYSLSLDFLTLSERH